MKTFFSLLFNSSDVDFSILKDAFHDGVNTPVRCDNIPLRVFSFINFHAALKAVLNPVTTCFKPLNAFCQSPENIPVRKSINPLSTFVTPFTTSDTTVNKSKNLSPNFLMIGAKIGIIFLTTQFINGCKIFFQSTFTKSATLPSKSIIPSKAGCTCFFHVPSNSVAKFFKTGAI